MEGRVKAKGSEWLVTCDAISPVGPEIFSGGGVKLRKPKTGNPGWRALRGRPCVHEAWPQLSDNGTLARLGRSKAKISLQSLPELLCRTGSVQKSSPASRQARGSCSAGCQVCEAAPLGWRRIFSS